MDRLNCLRCEYEHKDNGNCTAVGGFCTAVTAAHCKKLKEYLDTGMTPEKIRAQTNALMAKSIAQITEFEGIPVARLRQLAEADRDGRCVVLKPEQQPSKDGQKKPECFYTDKPSGEFCLGYCHYGDEPIEACQECWWLDGNDDFRAEAGAALAGKEQNNEKS